MKISAKRYRQYLQSVDWKLKRAAAISRVSNRCQVCNGPPPLHVHHRTYERFGREKPEDLTVLCVSCHRRYHEPENRRNRAEKCRARRDIRRDIDEQILQIVGTARLIKWRDVQRQIKAPRAQAWARADKLLKRRELAWKYGKLCLYTQQDLV